jgi:hypothetical protein
MLNAPQPPGAGNISNVAGTQPPTRRAGAEKAAFKPLELVIDVPATPPPDALVALDRAAGVANELRDRKVGVQFQVPDDGGIRVRFLDVRGKELRQIPVAYALELLSGEGPVTIFDELA